MRIESTEMVSRPVSKVFAFYADDHLQNHPRWDPEMQLSLATDGEVGIGTVFNRSHTHFGDPVQGTMTVIDFERDQLFGLAIDDGFGEFYARLGFEPVDSSTTKITATIDLPHVPDSADDTQLLDIVDRWLRDIEHLM